MVTLSTLDYSAGINQITPEADCLIVASTEDQRATIGAFDHCKQIKYRSQFCSGQFSKNIETIKVIYHGKRTRNRTRVAQQIKAADLGKQ